MSVLTTPQQPFSIKATPEEVRNGRLTERHLEQAVRHILEDGLVVVENAVKHSVLDKLNEKMVEDAKYLRGLGEKGPFNYNLGNLQQDAPPVREHFDPSIFLSERMRALASVADRTRSTSESHYFDSPWTSSKDDILQRKHRNASN